MLYESDNNIIRNNTNTINFNKEYGIYLSLSDYNQINGNTINNNLVGIYILESNYNVISNNNLRYNTQSAVVRKDSIGNTFNENIPSIRNGDGQISIEMIILIAAIGTVVVLGITGAVVLKKRRSIPIKEKREKRKLKEEERREKEKFKEEGRLKKERLKKEKEQQKIEVRERKIEQDFQKKVSSVDILIKENKIEEAIKNLLKIQKEAQSQGLVDILNKVEERIITCKKLEVETVNRIKQTILTLGTKFTRFQLMDICERSGIKDEFLIESVIMDMIKNKEIRGDYFSTSKALSLEAALSPSVEEKTGKLNVFISYSTLDTDYFQVAKLVRRLELYPEINEVSFWEADSKQNIVEFMEETLNKTDVFLLFCSENASKSEAVRGEWQSAYQMVKKGLIKIIPVYEDEDLIPKLLWQMLNVKFTSEDFEGFIQKLHDEIIR
jgi:parallel beta-helix repeat protein